jgi:sigma-B regulation protein RsbU (phosphoserine phosphatase)
MMKEDTPPQFEGQMTTEQTGKPQLASRPVTVLLVDDQTIVAESIRRMLAAEPDVQFHYCQDPTKAIETANRVQPTVILQDLVMPDIDGLMLVKFYRANKPTRDVPLIVLSSKEEPAIKAQAFALGANDYLVKWPDKLEVLARVRYHSRGYIALLERNEAYRQLEESQRLLASEVAQAARYVESLLPAPLTGPVTVSWRFVPSTQLGGDMFGYHWLSPDHLALYLLDVSGHGVGSSLLAVSAANVLSAQSLPSTDFRDPGEVVSRLNDVFQMERQDSKFFTIWYGVYDKSARRLAFCNGGHPPPLLFSGPTPAEAPLTMLKTTGPLVGMLPPGMPFQSKVVELGASARLLLYSDGVFEIERPDGVMWTLDEFVAHVTALPPEEPLLDPLLAHVRQLRAGPTLADDFSALEVRF